MSIPNLLTVRQFSQKHQAFPEGGLRSLIFYASFNGMARSGALVRDRGRVLINEQKFFDWMLEPQNGKRGAR